MFSLMGNCISCIKNRRQPKREIVLAMVGLDGAGKTTTLKALQAEPLEVSPTVGFGNENIQFGRYDITVYDLGGGKRIRDIWKDYFADLWGIVFVVDSAARNRLEEVKDSMKNVLQHPMMAGKPLLLLANKQDLKHTMDEVDLIEGLDVENVVNKNRCPCRIETCSALQGTGRKMDKRIKNGLTWLCNVIDQCHDTLSQRIEKDKEEVRIMREKEKQEIRERVRKRQEEREKQEEEEKKRLEKLGFTVEEEEDEEEEEIHGDPFKQLDINELMKKEAKAKEEKKKRKELERQLLQNDTKLHEKENNDIEDFRVPRSSRSLLSYGLQNGNMSNRSNILNEDQKLDDNDYLSNLPVSSRNKLPPLQEPIGTKFMEPAPVKKRKNKKLKERQELDEIREPGVGEFSDDQNPQSQSKKSLQSVSKIEVSTKKGYLDSDEEDYNPLRRSEEMNGYADEDTYRSNPPHPDSSRDTGREGKKKKKKKRLSNDQEIFDALRSREDLNMDDKTPRKSRGLRALDGGAEYEEERSETPVKKLKKKKRNLRKNKLAPSDDEIELSDVRDPPRDSLPWTRDSQKRLESPDPYVSKSINWGLAEDLPTTEVTPRRTRPNFDSEDDLIL